MASHLPSPPSSRPSSPDSSSGSPPRLVEAETPDPEMQVEPQHQSKEEEPPDGLLSDRLDALLVSYLAILDTYTNLRAQLSKDLSGGFFALAQANRNANSTLGVGRRYGEEGFDERMKAAKVVRIEEARSAETHTSYKEEDEDATTQKNGPEMKRGKTPAERNDETEALTADSEEDVLRSATPSYRFSVSSSSTLGTTMDPLKWYGILIPPALRTCQTSFATAISSTVAEVLNAASAMRSLEEEIWAVRRQLGIVNNHAIANVDELGSKDSGNAESDATASKTAEGRSSESSLTTRATSTARSHTSQAKKSSSLLYTATPAGNLQSEPCSRFLKLG